MGAVDILRACLFLYGQKHANKAEILTYHNEMICSTSAESIVTGHDAELEQIETLIISSMTFPDPLQKLATT